MKSGTRLWQALVFKNRLLNSIRTRGLSASLYQVFKDLVSFFWLDVTLFKYHIIREKAYHLERPLPGIELREARPEDYPELLEFSIHFSEQQMLRRFALDHRCIIARTEGRIISYSWIGLNKIWLPYFRGYLEFPADTAYCYNTFTDENYRDRRIFQAFASYTRGFCEEHNLPFGFTLVDPKIGLPVRAYAKLVGADRISLVRYQRRFGIKVYSEQEISTKEAVRLSKKSKR